MNSIILASPGIVITYARTENLFSGQSWPPDGSDFWAVVTRDRTHTIWRRIAIAADKNLRASQLPPTMRTLPPAAKTESKTNEQ
jgi:hypothetical protein